MVKTLFEIYWEKLRTIMYIMKKDEKIFISAPGKIIISGEHSVVYGYPALLAATNRRLEVNEKLEVSSQIPLGCGMGSSAAYSVAISAMKIRLAGNDCSHNTVRKMADKMERDYHTNPSGADVATCTYGGYIWFHKKPNSTKNFLKVKAKNSFNNFFLHNTGKPAETTREMVVEVVGKKYRDNKVKTENIFACIEKVTRDFLDHITGRKNIDIGKLITENERLLEELGVVSPLTIDLIRQIENIGGAAKVTGAGGSKNASGLVLIYHPEKEKLEDFMKDKQLELDRVKLGEPGLTIDQKIS